MNKQRKTFSDLNEATAARQKYIADGCQCSAVESKVLPGGKGIEAWFDCWYGKTAGFNFFFPGQALREFYPELQHEVVDYPNYTNSPMPADIRGEVDNDAEGLSGIDLEELSRGSKPSFIVSYVSTSPAAAAGIGRDGKPTVLEGAPLRKPNDIRGPGFTEEFYSVYQGIPGKYLVTSSFNKKASTSDIKLQLADFFRKVMGEVAATFLAAFKVTGRPVLHKVPGTGKLNLTLIEQENSPSFNNIDTGSRLKYLLRKLNDGDIRELINQAWAMGSIHSGGKEGEVGGFLYEVFCRLETIDVDSMEASYTYIIGTKESE